MIQCVPLANLYDFLLLTKYDCTSLNLVSASKSVGTGKREQEFIQKSKNIGKRSESSEMAIKYLISNRIALGQVAETHVKNIQCSI